MVTEQAGLFADSTTPTAPRCRMCARPARWLAHRSPCLDPIRHVVARLKAHHVPHELARQLTTDPTCEVCGRDILGDTRTLARPLLAVDHDHTCCCPGSTSCGRCVRGLLCQQCNAALGMIRDDPTTARALADYLTKPR